MTIVPGKLITADPVVFIVHFDDQDYYCEGDHILGVYASRPIAEEAIAAVKIENAGNVHRRNYEYSVGEYPISSEPVPGNADGSAM